MCKKITLVIIHECAVLEVSVVCFYYQDSNRIIQHCAYSILFRIGCTQRNYNIMGNDDSLCCVEDYCNSKEIFLEFRANLSAQLLTMWYK